MRTLIGAPLILHALLTAAPPEAQVRVSLAPRQDSSTSGLLLATPTTDLSVYPSLTPTPSLPGNRGPQSIQLSIGCNDAATGIPIPNCYVALSLSQQDGSGGHIHAASGNITRPPGIYGTGSISPSAITTGPNGEPQTVTYSAPRTSGIVDLRVDSFPPAGTGTSSTLTIGVFVPGLVELARDGFMYTIVYTTNHGLANWFTSDMWAKVERLPSLYFHEVPIPLPPGTEIPRLVYTGASLERGGLFDYRGDWSPPHNSHDDGRDLDIAKIEHLEYRAALGRAIRNACIDKMDANERWTRSCLSQPVPGERTYDPFANHYHVRGVS